MLVRVLPTNSDSKSQALLSEMFHSSCIRNLKDSKTLRCCHYGVGFLMLLSALSRISGGMKGEWLVSYVCMTSDDAVAFRVGVPRSTPGEINQSFGGANVTLNQISIQISISTSDCILHRLSTLIYFAHQECV